MRAIGRRAREKNLQRIETEASQPRDNLLEQQDAFNVSQALPYTPSASEMELIMRQLKLDDDSIAILRTLNRDREAAWRAILEQSRQRYAELSRLPRDASTEDELAAVTATFDAYRSAFEQIVANEARFVSDAQLVLSQLDEQAAKVIRLARTWAVLSAPPPTLPPVYAATGSLRFTLSPHLERANPARILLALELSPERLQQAIDVLTELTPAVHTLSLDLRRAALGGDILRRFISVNQNTDHQLHSELKAKQSESAKAAFAARVKLLQQLVAVHEAVIATLDDEAAAAYRAELRRIAYPSLARHVERARGLFHEAGALSAVSDAQRREIEAAAAGAEGLTPRVEEAADEAAGLIFEFALADDFNPENARRLAYLHARIDQALFELQTPADAALRRLRPILTQEQMQALHPEP